MTVECPRCASNRQRSTWHATGRLFKSRRGLPRATLKCDMCGRVFDSGVKEALDAAAAERGDCEMDPTPAAAPVYVPQPTLPMPVKPPQTQGFVTPASLVKHTTFERYLDRKRAASGEED